MRSSPAVRRAPVHAFSDGVAKHVPKRSVEQALKHEVTADAVSSNGALTDPDDIADALAAMHVNTSPAQPTAAQAIALRAVTTEDIDQLWDWCRQDKEGVTAFLGMTPANSRDLFKGMINLDRLQAQHQAIVRGITRDGTLIGFSLVAPIQYPKDQPPIGTVHLYITQSARGDISNVVQGMLNEFDASHPPMTLSVIATREWSPVLEPFGFTSQTVLTRPARMTSQPHG